MSHWLVWIMDWLQLCYGMFSSKILQYLNRSVQLFDWSMTNDWLFADRSITNDWWPFWSQYRFVKWQIIGSCQFQNFRWNNSNVLQYKTYLKFKILNSYILLIIKEMWSKNNELMFKSVAFSKFNVKIDKRSNRSSKIHLSLSCHMMWSSVWHIDDWSETDRWSIIEWIIIAQIGSETVLVVCHFCLLYN